MNEVACDCAPRRTGDEAIAPRESVLMRAAIAPRESVLMRELIHDFLVYRTLLQFAY